MSAAMSASEYFLSHFELLGCWLGVVHDGWHGPSQVSDWRGALNVFLWSIWSIVFPTVCQWVQNNNNNNKKRMGRAEEFDIWLGNKCGRRHTAENGGAERRWRMNGRKAKTPARTWFMAHPDPWPRLLVTQQWKRPRWTDSSSTAWVGMREG